MRTRSPLVTSLAAVAGFVWIRYAAFRPLGYLSAFHAAYRASPDGTELLLDGVKVLLVFTLLLLTYRMTVAEAADEVGVARGVGVGLGIGLITALPMLVILAIISSINPNVTVLSMLRTSLGSSIAEETLYRGYLFRQLYRRAGWNFWLASLANGVPWALGHLYQTSQTGLTLVAGTAEILVVMTLSAALAAWVYVEWDYNLWVVIGVHGVANGVWMFLGENNRMTYGWIGNTVRVSTYLVIVAATLIRRRRRGSRAQRGKIGSAQ